MEQQDQNLFKQRLLAFIEAMSDSVFLRAEVNALGSSRQLSRGLKALINDGRLVRLGYGVYAKAEFSELIGSPLIKIGFADACLDALKKLGVKWDISRDVRDYNEGLTTQVPARFEVRLKSRFRGRLTDGRRRLFFEDGVYAR